MGNLADGQNSAKPTLATPAAEPRRPQIGHDGCHGSRRARYGPLRHEPAYVPSSETDLRPRASRPGSNYVTGRAGLDARPERKGPCNTLASMLSVPKTHACEAGASGISWERERPRTRRLSNTTVSSRRRALMDGHPGLARPPFQNGFTKDEFRRSTGRTVS